MNVHSLPTRPSRPARPRRPSLSLAMGAVAAIGALVVACTGPGTTASPGASSSPSANPGASVSPPAGPLTLYTTVTQDTVDAVLAGHRSAHPGVAIELFRAPTAELAARIAADLRDGRVRADVLWLTDPLSIQGYAEQGLLRTWQPTEAAAIDAAFRGDSFWGTRFLNMVIVRGDGVTPGPMGWQDLTDPAYRDAVAIPDPGFAGSALGALGYFAQTEAFGLEFYRSMKENGAVQVRTPDEVTTGVAEARFMAGMTLDNSARTAIDNGSPIELVWPSDGAVAVYSPIAVIDATHIAPVAEGFVEFVLSAPGQQAIAGTGWQPIRPGSGGPEPGGAQVYPDWANAFAQQADLLMEYRAIFGG